MGLTHYAVFLYLYTFISIQHSQSKLQVTKVTNVFQQWRALRCGELVSPKTALPRSQWRVSNQYIRVSCLGLASCP